MINRFAVGVLTRQRQTVVDANPQGEWQCICCELLYLSDGVIATDNGLVCFNCLKALADSYFDSSPA